MSEFNPRRALLILFGAKQWPKCTSITKSYKEGENPFENSSKGIEDYFLNNLGIKEDNFLNLFDSEDTSTALVGKIKTFIDKKKQSSSSAISSITDLFLYYIGHGKGERDDYRLFVRSTDENSLASTSFSAKFLKDLEQSIDHFRCYIIVDACFSGNMLGHTPKTSKGTVLLCSTTDEEISHSAGNGHSTVFTGAFLKVVEENKEREAISFSHLRTLVASSIRETYKDDTNKIVLPEIYTINQKEDIANLPIFAFHQRPKKLYEGSVKWHITTSSKGGVGKTLLSLFLVASCTELKKIPLVIDFNGVNADLKQLIFDSRYVSNDANKTPQVHPVTLKNDNELYIVKIDQNSSGSYLLGWLKNPYELFGARPFLGLLSTLREELPAICSFFKTEEKNTDTVIIDTNYHFGNLFSSQTDDYSFFPTWEKDRFSIWFIWVYRQIQNCYNQTHSGDTFTKSQLNSDVGLMRETANKIESFVSHNTQYNQKSPFIHVINPVSLTEDFSLLKQLLGINNEVEVLRKLADIKESNENSLFTNILDMMVEAQEEAVKNPKADDNQFLQMLMQLEKTFNKTKKTKKSIIFSTKSTPYGTRPKNLFPIYVYEEKLAKGYHHKFYSLEEIRNFDVYAKVFYKLFSNISKDK